MPDEKEKKTKRVKVKVEEKEEIEESNAKSEEEVTDEPKIEETKEREVETKPDVPMTTEISSKRDRIPVWILFLSFLIGLMIGAGLIGGVFYYKTRSESFPGEPTSEPSETMAPGSSEESPTPEASPSAEVDYSTLSVSVLNGSGIKGEAGKVQGLLESLEFKSVETGNADRYDYEETEVMIKSDVSEAVFDDIKDALADYKVTLVADSLEETSNFEIVITVGQARN